MFNEDFNKVNKDLEDRCAKKDDPKSVDMKKRLRRIRNGFYVPNLK